MKYIFIIVFIILFPFLLNTWHGYLKPAQKSEIQHMDCSYIQGKLRPYIDDIIKVIERRGTKLDSTYNSNSSEGYKIIRNDMKKYLPEVFMIIEEYVSSLRYNESKPVSCDKDKYCWFLRLYNKDGHFLDWHFDNNFTVGPRHTFVCNIFISKCNTSHFMTKDMNNRIHIISSESGSGVIYNGTDVKHAISSQTDDCVRVALIVPMYENEHMTFIGRWRKWARGIIYHHLKL
jgi:hypothetical protein